MEEYIKKTIICKDCGKDFALSVGEQKFYEEKGLSHPTRCKDCRLKRKTSFEKKEEKVKETSPAKRTMTQEEIDDVLKQWKENTVYFKDVSKGHNYKNKKNRTY